MASRTEAKRTAVFHPEFLEDLTHWVDTDRRTARRLLELVKMIVRDPFQPALFTKHQNSAVFC